jgi:hypothetical protein
LNAPGSTAVTTFTNLDGEYSLSNFGSGSYTVTPSKTDENSAGSNGIFSNDAALISRHVVGLTTLSPVQLRAARVSGLPNVSSFDAALIAQWIVGITNAPNQTGKWKFTPSDRTYPDVNASQADQDYQAILMGDVSGDWAAPITRPAPTAMNSVSTPNAVIAAVPGLFSGSGTSVTIPFRIDNLGWKAVSSYQFDLEYDPLVIEPAQLPVDVAGTRSDGLSVAVNSPTPGLLKVTVFGAIPVSGDGVFLDLKFTVKGRPGSSTRLTIHRFRFNDGQDEVKTVDGRITVEDVSQARSRLQIGGLSFKNVLFAGGFRYSSFDF